MNYQIKMALIAFTITMGSARAAEPARKTAIETATAAPTETAAPVETNVPTEEIAPTEAIATTAPQSAREAFRWVRGQVFISTQEAPFPTTVGVSAAAVVGEYLRLRAGSSVLGVNVKRAYGIEADVYLAHASLGSPGVFRPFIGFGYREYQRKSDSFLGVDEGDDSDSGVKGKLAMAGVEYVQGNRLFGAQFNAGQSKEVKDGKVIGEIDGGWDQVGGPPLAFGLYVGMEF